MLTGLLTSSMVVCLAGYKGNRAAQTSAPQGRQEEAKKDKAGSKMATVIIFIAQGDPFLALAYAGMERLGGEYGIETKIMEALDKSEYSEQIRTMTEAGVDPVYVTWDDLAAGAVKIASDFPDTKLIVVDCYVASDLGNMKAIVAESQEATFIAGMVVAETSENKRVSWIDSADQSVISKLRAGFETGVTYMGLSVECKSLYIGDTSDPDKGGELVEQVVGRGADVVMHSTNKANPGAIRACEGGGVKTIGADERRGAINEDVVFWSAPKDTTDAVHHAGESALDNTPTTRVDVYNISFGLKLYDDKGYAKLPDDTKRKVDGTVEKMKNDGIEVPSDVE